MKKTGLTKTLVTAAALVLLAGCTSTMTSTGSATGTSGTSGTDASTAAAESGTTKGEDTVAGKTNGETVTAVIEVKDYGTITLALDASAAPETVENFVSLAQSGFYDGLTFHRIMAGFMMQGGDPTGTGMGGSDKNIKGEFAANGVDNPLSHTRGTISMARATDMNSASSQFFICHKDALFLDGNYAAFGQVTDGMDVVDRVCEEAEPTDDNGTIPAENQPVITSIVIK